MGEIIAERDWHVRAHVKVLTDYSAGSVDPPARRVFKAGEVVTLIRWGLAGRPVDDAWWTCQDIDSAFIVPGEYAAIIHVLDEVSPLAPRPRAGYDEDDDMVQDVLNDRWHEARSELGPEDLE